MPRTASIEVAVDARITPIVDGLDHLRQSVADFMETWNRTLHPGYEFRLPLVFAEDVVKKYGILSVTVSPDATSPVPYSASVPIILYPLYHNVTYSEALDGIDDEGDDATPACEHKLLPCTAYVGLWEALHFDARVKESILGYVDAAAAFAVRGVQPSIITYNRVVLLHGPPGTGKTSLCRAVAQRLAISMRNRTPRTVLMELNAHSLFSRYFSESGKLVAKQFRRIRDVLSSGNTFGVLLIDEVESLVMARNNAIASNEPGDAVRVVNAVLTQIDCISAYPNCLVMATSNLSEALDLAFLDRADMKIFIGPPGCAARKQILGETVAELFRAGLVTRPGGGVLSDASNVVPPPCPQVSASLEDAAKATAGLSGRRLRKLPLCVMAVCAAAANSVTFAEYHAEFIRQVSTELGSSGNSSGDKGDKTRAVLAEENAENYVPSQSQPALSPERRPSKSQCHSEATTPHTSLRRVSHSP